ncbi:MULTISPECIES: hypothetical protein [unclassified Moorena]|nr:MULTISPECIES: hypothetical protein [unclassified Moorena]
MLASCLFPLAYSLLPTPYSLKPRTFHLTQLRTAVYLIPNT